MPDLTQLSQFKDLGLGAVVLGVLMFIYKIILALRNYKNGDNNKSTTDLYTLATKVALIEQTIFDIKDNHLKGLDERLTKIDVNIAKIMIKLKIN